MGTTSVEFPFFVINNAHSRGNSRFLSPKVEFSTVKFPSAVEFSKLNLKPSSTIVCCTSEEFNYQKHGASDEEKKATPILDTVESPLHLKNLSPKELRQLSDDIRSELSFIMSKTRKPLKASLEVVELTVALHYVFHAPIDKILWDVEEHTYPHKLLTGRRATMQMHGETNDLSGSSESIFDPIGTGHGCNSISAGLGMAVARDIKCKRDRVVAVISNQTTMAGQVYEAMSNAGYLDSDMIVILNDTRHSLKPKVEQVPKRSINALSSILSKVQSSKFFRRFREFAKHFTKQIGRGMHEWAAKVDEYARGLIGPPGSTLFEELGLYYIGPVDGHNIEDLICILNEVAALDYMGPVLLHVITKQDEQPMPDQSTEVSDAHKEDSGKADFVPSTVRPKTYSDCFVEALILEAERDKDIVAVHAGIGMEPSLLLFKERFPERFFEVGMAEQHAVTFAAGLSRGGLKPFCIIPSAFLQRAYDQVVHDVDRQKIPVRFVISSAGFVGSDGPVHTGAFDITYMSCLPNMIVMAPGNEVELAHMVTTAAQIDDVPVCFRYPRGAIAKITDSFRYGVPIEIGKGRVLIEGRHVALLGYGSMVQNCLKAQSILEQLGVNVTVADARFCKPLDINLIRTLCDNHSFLITVEEGAVGGFGSRVAQFISLDGQLDAGIKWRPITLPDTYIERASPEEQLSVAGLSGNHIAATTLSLLGRNREALLLLC